MWAWITGTVVEPEPVREYPGVSLHNQKMQERYEPTKYELEKIEKVFKTNNRMAIGYLCFKYLYLIDQKEIPLLKEACRLRYYRSKDDFQDFYF